MLLHSSQATSPCHLQRNTLSVCIELQKSVRHHLMSRNPVTCMDARIDPAAAFGIALGDAHVIRNAGGNAKDALRSILISQHLLGTREIILIKHTGCGMLTFTNEDAKAAVQGNGGKVDNAFDFQPFPELEAAVKRDVEFLTDNESFPKDVAVSGWVYDVTTGNVARIV
jgi:carbonic anhydrase